MKIEDLVPTLELCKQIPEGEFADSVFVWARDWHGTNEWMVAFRDLAEPPHLKRKNPPVYPAPTMGEILKRKTGVEDWGGDYLEFLMRDLL